MAERVAVGFLVVLGAVFGVGILTGKVDSSLVNDGAGDD